MNIGLIIDQLPKETLQCKIKLGYARNKLLQIATIENPTESEIIDSLDSFGFGEDYPFGRIMWYDETHKCIKTYSITAPTPVAEQTDLRATLDVLLQMVGEVRRFSSVQNDTVEIMAQSNQKLVERNMELREEVMEERSTSVALDLALQDAEKEGEMNYKERALEVAAQGVQAYMASKGKITPESIKRLMLQHPEFIDELVKDEEVVKLIGSRIMSSKLEGGESNAE